MALERPAQHAHHPALLLAPMMDLDACMLAHRAHPNASSPEHLQRCREQASSDHLIHSTLVPYLQPPVTTAKGEQPVYEMGYTYKVPLLQLYEPLPGGQWRLDPMAVNHVARTIETAQLPTVLYLFSNHFSAPAPVEAWLAQDSRNLAHVPAGPLPPQTYHGLPLYPWSVANTSNTLTAFRTQAVQTLAHALCQRHPDAVKHLRAITLLGETQQLFPRFEDGMGYTAPYAIADHSPDSVSAFAAVHGQTPPQKLTPYSHGWLPVSGWVHDARSPQGQRAKVLVELNGQRLALLSPELSRQDVATALPSLGTAQLGYQHLLDFRLLQTGWQQLQLTLLTPGEPPVLLGRRNIWVGPEGDTPTSPRPAQRPVPALPPGVQGWLDLPEQAEQFHHVPLAAVWHTFRQQQVVDYLRHFDDLLRDTCLADVPRFTHQIFPQANPGWDATRFAVEASLRPDSGLQLGVSLYGEASWGDSFRQWYKQSGHHSYGITEFHPLRPMNGIALHHLLQTHAQQGARFVSFFLETRWHDRVVSAHTNPYAFDPQNPVHGSAQLREASLHLLRQAQSPPAIPFQRQRPRSYH